MSHLRRRKDSSVVVQGVNLCRYCAEREGLRTSSHSSRLECALCGGLLSQLTKMASTVIEKSKEYEFETFLIGASLPQALLDREDELRARLKIKGKENLKSQITRIVSRKVVLATGKKVDYSRPDLTIVLSPTDNSVVLTPRSIWVKAAYRKLVRGIAQRASMCEICNGVGCAACNYSGKKGASVQSVASSYFMKLFDAESCNFVWLGSEDENSLVEGAGRPFFVEMMKPKKRAAHGGRKMTRRRKNLTYYSEYGVEISPPEILKAKPQQVPQFEVLAKVYLKRSESPDYTFRSEDLAKDFKNGVVSVRLSRKYRIVQRKIRSIEAVAKDSLATLSIRCDGGIPLKKLVTGQDGTVEPNLSSYISGYEIEKESPFDVLDVQIKRTESGASSYMEPLTEELATAG
jgi:tRNA pseudouridine synthase 10